MNRVVPAMIMISLAVAATGCAVSPEAAARAAEQSRQELASALEGRVAGKPVSCLPDFGSNQMQVIDDQTLLYRDGKTIYLQKPRGACYGLANGSYTLVTRKYGSSQTCKGDINELVDLRSGIRGPACIFEDFIPYTKAN